MSSLERVTFPNMGASVQSFDAMAFAKWKIDEFNRTPGDLPGPDCPKCRNKGYIMVLREDGSPLSRECSCVTMRRCVRRMEESGLRDVIKNCTFDRFQAGESWQRTVLQSAMDYAKNPEGWFLICGQSGAGKSHLCTAICRELLLQSQQVVYASWRQEIGEIKAMALDAEGRGEKLSELKNAQVLYIDDLFKTGAGPMGEARPTAADISLAFEILNPRYMSRRITIVSTEFLPDELLRFDEALGGRLMEMAKGHTLVIDRRSDRNYRMRGVPIL